MSAPASTLEHGTSSNRYAILGRLGGGGMADIYLARSQSIAGVERHVVLKRVIPEKGNGTPFAKMFLDEARLAAQLQHPNIAQVHDVGMLGGSYFFTMEYVHGKDLRAVLHALASQRRQMPLSHVVHIAIGALSALHHAHEAMCADGEPLGVVHRDVSPSNIMVSYEGAVKLLDFGVAKARQNSEATRAGTIKGKIGYVSPEQCRAAPVDRRSDLFSLGIVLHELLTTRRLYRRDSDFNVMNAIIHESPPPPSLYRIDLPPQLDRIVLKALHKEPLDRYETAQEMLDDLEALVGRDLHPSASALGRFMRELFGERKEPWKELPKHGDETKMTVTGESAHSLAAGSHDQIVADQLERAPDLVPSNERLTVSEVPPLLGSRALPLPRRVPRWPRIAVPILGAVAAALAIAWCAAPSTDGVARSASASPPPGPMHAAPPPPAAVDAGVLAIPIDAPERTISAMFQRGDWLATLQLCVAATGLAPADQIACTIAACHASRRAVAVDFYAGLPVADRSTVERACRVDQIELRSGIARPALARPAPSPIARPDPCDIDPLQCQK